MQHSGRECRSLKWSKVAHSVSYEQLKVSLPSRAGFILHVYSGKTPRDFTTKKNSFKKKRNSFICR